ncbi:MAG: amidohydrolase family protein, partial [Actinobacteria bacterium]|nr:amidohydrolase family protein [Actinomycetota bacterium]
VGHDYPGKTPTTPAPVYRYLKKFPDTTTILAHWGGGLIFYELMPEVAKLTSSVYYDTAASPYLFRKDIYSIAVEIAGAGRILFGSDFPLIKINRHLSEIEEAGLSGNVKESILGKNAQALLGHRF